MTLPEPSTHYEREVRRRLAVELFRRSIAGGLVHLFFIPLVVVGSGYTSVQPVYGWILLALSIGNALARSFVAWMAHRDARASPADIARPLLALRLLLTAQTVWWSLIVGGLIFEFRLSPVGLLVLACGIAWTVSTPMVIATDPNVAKVLVVGSSIPFIAFCIRYSDLTGFLGIPLALLMGGYAYMLVVMQHGYVRGLIEAKLDLEIKQAQLESAQDELHASTASAQQAAAAKGQFLANMSHEIRTPLNGILGLSDMLAQSGNLRGSDLELVDDIKRSGQHLLAIVNDILDFTKITAGKLQIESTPVDLRDLLRGCAAPFRQIAIHKNLELAIDFAPGLPMVVCTDPVRLRQVIVNLLANALKFTSQGEVRLGAQALDETLQITVSDTGIGIAPDRLEQIFREFEQAESSTTRRFGGTGLGLAISRSLSQLLGGSLVVESVTGSGSRFLLRLPLVVPSPALSGEETPGESTATAPVFQTPAGYRILIVDDNAVNRRVCRHFLEKTGGLVEVASGAREAIEMHRRLPFDLIFMDCHMPEMDGWEATRAIRALQDRLAAEVPIVALTANVMQDVKQQCEESGMNGHVGKPIVPEELFAVLRQHSGPGAQRTDHMERDPGARIR